MKHKVSVQQVNEHTNVIDCYPFEVFPDQCNKDINMVLHQTVREAENKFRVCLDSGGDDNAAGLTVEELSFYEDLPAGVTAIDVANFIRDTFISNGLPCGPLEPMHQLK